MSYDNLSISLIIPTLNAGDELSEIFSLLKKQTVSIDEYIIIDSGSTDDTLNIARKNNAKIIQIEKQDFDHGVTRHKAFIESHGDLVLFLTQDAVPSNSKYVENLIAPLIVDPQIAMVSGRQIAKSDAKLYERYVREFNYPAISNVREQKDIKQYGIKAFFASDTCSVYRRCAYFDCGGFCRPCLTNEDMFMAATFLHRGYKVAYASDACVFHSHNLSFKQQFKRNALVGYAIEKHKELLGDISESSEGVKLAVAVFKRLLKGGHIFQCLLFFNDCLARLLGNKYGKYYFRKHTVKYV